MKDWVYIAFSALMVAASLTLNSVHESDASRTAFPREIEQKPVLVNLNNADAAELMKVPGIGEKKAGDIIKLRESKGKFRSVEEITEVKGIKKATLDRIRKYIYVEVSDTAD